MSTSSATHPLAPLATQAPSCPRCGQAMDDFSVEGHYGRQVSIDICSRCHLAWFDALESVHLSGLGWVALLRRMQLAPEGAGPLAHELDCPRCQARLKPVQNLNRFGRFAALECPRRHGHLQTFALLLAERGLVRPFTHADFQTLKQEGRTAGCLQCGGPLEQLTAQCTWCESPLVVLDMPRLFTALLMRFGEPLPVDSARHVSWQCRGCGAPVEPAQSARCERCQHEVVVPSVLDLRPVMDQAEPLLRLALPREARPHGHKLRAMRGDARNTTTHRFLDHARDLFGGSDSGSVPTWAGLLLLAAAVWWFWF